jgi:HKD family nuclease
LNQPDLFRLAPSELSQDMDDPRGGVRHVIPSRGNHLASAAPLATGTTADPFARHLGPLLLRATGIDVVAAFVQMSGLRRVRPSLDAALTRGAVVRVITGDYLAITQAEALELLLDWQATSALPADEEAARPAGRLEARVVEVDRLPAPTRSFHPKAWRFTGPGLGVAFVGSSNLSHAALSTAVEWNLRVERDRDAKAWERGHILDQPGALLRFNALGYWDRGSAADGTG